MDALISRANELLRKPSLDDPEATRDARMLWIMILSLNVIGVLVMISSIAFRPIEDLLTTGGFTITVLCLSTYLLKLLQQGKHIRAGHIFSSFFSLLFFVNAVIFNGIRDVNITIYFLLVLMAGLALGKRGLAIYGSVSVVSIIILFIAERNDLFSATFTPYPIAEDLIILNFVLVCACLLIFASLNNTDQGYKLLIKALEKLKQTTVSKEYADNLIASMEDMLFVVDQSMRIQTINESVTKRLGYSEPSLIGRPFITLFTPENEPEWIKAEPGNIALSSVIKQSDHKLIRNDGDVLDVSMSSSLIMLREGEYGVICIAHDITQQKATERALMVAKNEAIEFATAKSNFLTNMSHELRTPLNAVIGMSTLMGTTELDEEQLEYSDQIIESSQELMQIVEKLLDYTESESLDIDLDFAPVALEVTFLKILSKYETAAHQAGLEFIQNISLPDNLMVMADQERIDRTLSILLDNAIKFTRKGVIEVNIAGSALADDQIKVDCQITDTGSGIQANLIDKIFEPFQQADGSLTRQHQGTGIGLSLARLIVRKLGGDIIVQSEEGIGSTFSFSLHFKAAGK